MNQARDPRVDPKKADQVRILTSTHYRVNDRQGDVIHYTVSVGLGYSESECTLAEWRRHMADATVLHAAD